MNAMHEHLQAMRKFLLIFLLTISSQINATTLLVLGDSISAGFGIDVKKGWVNLLQEKFFDQLSVINGSISGDTTGGGLYRLPLLLQTHQPDFVIIELGGNDGLRGYPLNHLRENLYALINLCREHGAEPILTGMRIPPNYGQRYASEFEQVFPSVAKEADIPLITFNFDAFYAGEGLMQEDGIHPTEKGQPLILAEVELKLLELMPDLGE